MDNSHHLELPAKLESLEAFSELVSRCAENAGVDTKKHMQIAISLEEVLVNIINYSYVDTEGKITVKCSTESKNRFIVTIIDSGVPFNINTSGPPDLTSDISERAVGGLGIHLVKEMMDEVHYHREKNQNILKLIIDMKKED